MKLGKMMLCLGLALCVLAGCAVIPSNSGITSTTASFVRSDETVDTNLPIEDWKATFYNLAMQNLETQDGQQAKEMILYLHRGGLSFYGAGISRC